MIPQLIETTIYGTVCCTFSTRYGGLNQLWNQKLRFFFFPVESVKKYLLRTYVSVLGLKGLCALVHVHTWSFAHKIPCVTSPYYDDLPANKLKVLSAAGSSRQP